MAGDAECGGENREDFCGLKKFPRRGNFLFETEFHALSFFGLSNFAKDGLFAALALRNWLRKTHLRLGKRHNSALQHLAVETTDDVFIRLALIFSCNFDSHIAVHYTRL